MIAFADVGVSVRDATASAKWWEEKLGFVTFRLGGPASHAVLVAPPGDRFILHLCEGVERVEPGNTGIAFVATDVLGMAKRMEAKGVRFAEPARRTEWGASAKFEDPDGNVFWLVEGPPSLIRQTKSMRAGAKKAARRKPAKKPAKKRRARR